MASDLEELRGIGKVTAARLQDAGITSAYHLAIMNPEELEEMAGIDPARASRIIMEARRVLKMTTEPVNALEYEEIIKENPRLTTGVTAIDELLGGGLEPGAIYELAGEYGAGKTQLCHQLSVTVQTFDERLRGKALYIDTEGTFSPQRIRAIAPRFGIEPEKALKNIYVARVETVVALEEAVREAAPRLLENDSIRLIIIDSVIALYRAQFKGLEWLARRQQRLNYVLDWLKRLGRAYSPLYLVITNQVLTEMTPTKPGAALRIPAGGNIIAHASTHRLLLRKAGEKHIIRVLDSPYLPYKAQAEFKVTSEGVEDA